MTTTPAYETETCQIFVGRAEDVLPTFTTETFDLIVTDPPYGVEFESNFGEESHGEIEGDGRGEASREIVRAVISECVRLTRQKRHLYVFGPADALDGAKVSAVVPLVWDKQNVGMGDLSLPWGAGHEEIQFAVSLHRHAGKVGRDSLAARVRKGSVVGSHRTTGRNNRRHPTEKPVYLLRQLIESSSVLDDLVLDPFAGVCSTAVAAVIEGRRSVMVEYRPDYAEVGYQRVLEAERRVKALEGL